jgi:hypothetical protein
MTDRIQTSMNRTDVRAALARLPGLLSGRTPDPSGIVHETMRRLGEEALNRIHGAYLHKARGGVDEAGISWPPLKPETVAYKRQHAGLVRKKKGERPRGLLTEKQDARWRGIFAGKVRSLQRQGLSYEDSAANAAALAWHILKLEGARLIRDVFGGRHVDVLIDQGDLIESLSPGSGSQHQVFEVGDGAVKVGSDLPYALAHHKGVPSRNLPARRLWPDGDVPASWQTAFDQIIEQGIGDLIRWLLNAGGSSGARRVA